MKLLEQHQLIKTGPVDHADWNYKPVLGWVQRLRFRLALSLLPDQAGRLLEVGYGSGVFMPSLKAKALSLAGIDVHDKAREVRGALAEAGIRADLRTAAAEEIPFEDQVFDSVVAVSSLEFVSDLDQCCREVARVLRPGGVFVVITPGTSRILDFGLKVLTGKSAKDDFGDRRKAIIPTLQKHFRTERLVLSPVLIGKLVPVYAALRLKVT